MRSRVGVMSAVFYHDLLDESVRKIAESGFDLIELSGEQFEDFVALDKKGIDKLNELKTRYDLEYTVHGPLAGLMLDWPEEHVRKASVERLENYIRMASDVGSETLVVHPVSLTPMPLRISFYRMTKAKDGRMESVAGKLLPKLEVWMRDTIARGYEAKKTAQSILEAYEVAEERRVSMSCENLFYGFGKPEDFQFVLDEDRRYLNFTYDPAHAAMAKQGEYGWIRGFQKKIDHVHATDTDGKSDSHPVVGTGVVNWPKMINQLNEIGYKGSLVLENWDMDKALASKRYLESLMD